MSGPLLCSVILSQHTQAVMEPGVSQQVMSGSKTWAKFSELYTV
jgi:hypothetical protein